MRRNHVQNIIIHITDDIDLRALSDKVTAFHAEVIERRLNQSNLIIEQKIAVIDRIIENLKLREVNGIIK